MSLGFELVAGTLLAVFGVAYVLEPLFRWEPATEPQGASPADDLDADLLLAATPRARAIAALREIEFDRDTGKLDDADYEGLKARYTREAIEATRAEEGVSIASEETSGETDLDPLDALAEARIAKAAQAAHAVQDAPRTICPICGPRPEQDATFCSSCGRTLVG